MINLLPEPKRLMEKGGFTAAFKQIFLDCEGEEELLELARLRFWNCPGLTVAAREGEEAFRLCVRRSLEGIEVEKPELFREQGYDLEIGEREAVLRFENNAGFVNGITSLKQILAEEEKG